MPKNFKRGDDYLVYLNTGTFGSKTWALIKALTAPTFDPAKADIPIEEAGMSTGHIHGYGDPLISGTLQEDAGDANVTALIAAGETGDMKEVTIANGPIATAGTVHRAFEACITAIPLTAARGQAATWAIEFRRHGNSDNDIVKTTVSA